MNLLFEDNELLVVVKAAGMATESADLRKKDLVSELKSYLRSCNDNAAEPYLGVIHRLDQPVSGILVFAKNAKAASILSAQVSDGRMRKYYQATVEGKFLTEASSEDITLVDYLIRDPKQGKALVTAKGRKEHDGKIAKEAKLICTPLAYDPTSDTTKLRIRLLTGRFHQIRAQLSHAGHPVLRDEKYGAQKPVTPEGDAGIALCAYELHFLHPKTQQEMVFTI